MAVDIIAAIHLVLAIYGTLVYIQTPREGQKGRIPRIILSNGLMVAYVAGAIIDAVKLSSRGQGWMSITSCACDFLLASFYAIYQVRMFTPISKGTVNSQSGASVLFLLLDAGVSSSCRRGAGADDDSTVRYVLSSMSRESHRIMLPQSFGCSGVGIAG